MKTSNRRILFIFGFLAVAVLVVAVPVGIAGGRAAMLVAVKAMLFGAALLLLLWWLGRAVRALLWRVGRRLAFSYFLIGVLPIPMVLALAMLNGYLISGYFLGHLYRDAAAGLHSELAASSSARLESFSQGRRTVGAGSRDFETAYYRHGRRIAGGDRFPRSWPDWLVQPDNSDSERFGGLVALPDGTPTMAAAARSGQFAVVTLLGSDLESELTRRADVWVELLRSDDPQEASRVSLQILGAQFALQPLAKRRSTEERVRFFGGDTEDPGLLDRPVVWWGEIAGNLVFLGDGSTVSDSVTAQLNGSVRTVFRHLLSGSAELDTYVWASLIAVTSLLATIYAAAVVLAAVIIFTLSRAVNRLSRGTDAVRGGDFSVRIPVRRSDQVGQLQRSFNQMAANLEGLVAAVAQKEIVEKELAIARDLQRSLLPSNLPNSETLEFATLFEPSAAIGGDYYDILRFDDDRLAVVIADVSGHGLPTGLRMAMLKAALEILVEGAKRPEQILRRLSEMIKASGEKRFFVTASLATVDFRRGRVDLTNAGHPPAYVVRGDEVLGILLPGNPLGALGFDYGHQSFDLQPGDVVVWLSDGLIEATDATGEPIGYEGVREALKGPAPSAAIVRDRLLAAVERHTAGEPADDDRTLVAMRYSAPPAESAGSKLNPS